MVYKFNIGDLVIASSNISGQIIDRHFGEFQPAYQISTPDLDPITHWSVESELSLVLDEISEPISTPKVTPKVVRKRK
jgi:hypothetical protein